MTSQLTDASTGTLLWSDSAQAAVGDLFQLQDELARRIVESLKLPLTSHDQRLMHRDIPASAKAYDYYLRGNQLSYDSKQWPVARDLYLRSVEEDPRYAPAWARLGRIRHVMAKYLPTGEAGGTRSRRTGISKSARTQPGSPVDAQVVRATRSGARSGARRDGAPHPAGAIGGSGTPRRPRDDVRYCGLLDASVAAHERAIRLEPKIKTSVIHTWAFQGAHDRIVTFKPAEFPYLVPLSMAELGRRTEALAALREVESRIPTRVRDLVTAARCLLEGKAVDSIAAINRFVAEFRDPEALYYSARHLAHLNEIAAASDLFERVVAGGCFASPTFARDPWLAPLRKRPSFTKALRQAEVEHQKAADVFVQHGGEKLVGV